MNKKKKYIESVNKFNALKKKPYGSLSYIERLRMKLYKMYIDEYESTYGGGIIVNREYMTQPHRYDQDESLSPTIFKEMEIFISSGVSFRYMGNERLFSYPNDKPTSDKDLKWKNKWIKNFDHDYQNNPLKWWTGQLAAAIFIATTACGVTKWHLTHNDIQIRSIFIFHVYYTVRKILYDCGIPIPGERGFNRVNNGNKTTMVKIERYG